MRPPILTTLSLFLALAACLAGTALSAERSVFSAQAPQLLLAVGKLTVPGHDRVDGRRRQRDENCTASLVSPDTILTAWHCLEFYRDLSRDPVFSLPYVPGQVPVAARRISDGGDMRADWALLKLAQPILTVSPLPVASYRRDIPRVLLAGYARDEGLGAGGDRLTWQSDCQVLSGRATGTSCITYKGASGGPVIADGHIVGVISAGDSTAQTLFAPSTLFIATVRAHAR